MANEIIPYIEMCRREGVSLQRGMNFGIGGTHSVILMSLDPLRYCAGLLRPQRSNLCLDGIGTLFGQGDIDVDEPYNVFTQPGFRSAVAKKDTF